MGTCGTGLSDGYVRQPGDPENTRIITATPAFGGVDVNWNFPETNAEGVAHYRLFRGLNDEFDNAVQIASMNGNYYYDKSESATDVTYYYWVQLVTMNGGELDPVGPASATAQPPIASLMQDMTGLIDQGVLAESLKSQISRIDILDAMIETETSNRLTGLQDIGAQLDRIDSLAQSAWDSVQVEKVARLEDVSTFVGTVNGVKETLEDTIATMRSEVTAAYEDSIAQALTQYQTAADAETARGVLKQQIIAQRDANLASVLSAYQTEADGESARAALKNEVQAYTNTKVASSLTDYETASDADSARAALRDQVQTYTDNTLAEALTQYQTIADAESALASLRNQLQTETNNSIASALTDYETATDAASARAALGDTLRTERSQAIAQALTNYETSATAKAARASMSQALTTERDDAIATALTQYSTSSEINSALSELETNLTSSYEGAISSALQSYETAASAQAARSLLGEGLQNTIDDNYAEFVSERTSQAEKYSALTTDVTTLSAELNKRGGWTASFEDDTDMDRWSTSGTATITQMDDGYVGDKCALMTWAGPGSPISSGKTGAVWAKVEETSAMAFAGRRVRVSCYAKKPDSNAAGTFAMAYSTAETGNSGWKWFDPTTGWKRYSFTYDVPNPNNGGADYLGIWADVGVNDGNGVLIDYVTIEVTATEEDLPEVTAALGTEAQARADLEEALTSRLDTLAAQYEDAQAAIQAEQTARANGDSASAQALQTAQSALNDDIASVETRMDTKIDTLNGTVDEIGALYTAKVDVNGVIGGFGVYNDGTEVEAGFDVDTFWLGRTNSTSKTKPFILKNGKIYMDTALIQDATITEAMIGSISTGKLTDSDGNAITTVSGKIKSQYLEVDDLTVAEAAKFTGDVQSTNYVAGQSGWKIKQNGEIEINSSTSGGRVVQDADGIRVYDSNDILRVKLGKL